MNEREFQLLYDTTFPLISRYVVSKCKNIEDVKDILQNIYFDLYKRIDRIDQYKNDAYLLSVAKNKVNQYYRFRFRHKDKLAPLEDDIASDIDISRDIQIQASVDEIWDFLKKKPAIISKIFYFYFYLELTMKEIAMELDLSESNVKNYLYRTIKEIKSSLERDEENDNF